MKLKNKNTITFIIILIVSLFVAIPSIKMNIQYDDGIQHVCRLIGTERSIKEGNIFSTIISNLCNNFGYSWNLFYSPLTAYLPLIFRIIRIFVWRLLTIVFTILLNSIRIFYVLFCKENLAEKRY